MRIKHVFLFSVTYSSLMRRPLAQLYIFCIYKKYLENRPALYVSFLVECLITISMLFSLFYIGLSS